MCVNQARKDLQELPALSKLIGFADISNAEAQRISEQMHDAVKEHMRGIRASITRLWDSRDFKSLNAQLGANERADRAFCGYEEIYSSEWSRDIRETVETEIESIAMAARLYLHGKSEEQAEANMKDFALQLIYLGRILDDLPQFKDFCRQKMAVLLDTCHEQGSWGHCFLFKLGMLLGQGRIGDIDQDGRVVVEDDRIGKTIVSEFKHFKVCLPCTLIPFRLMLWLSSQPPSIFHPLVCRSLTVRRDSPQSCI